MKVRRIPTLIATLLLALAGATVASPEPVACQSEPCARAGCICKSVGNWTCAGDCSNARCSRTWLAAFRPG